MAFRTFLSGPEKEYIRQNCLSKTDKEIAKDLNRDVRTIAVARKKLGIEKKQSGKLAAVKPGQQIEKDNSPYAAYASLKLNERQRSEFFKTQLANSVFYANLKLQLTSDELDFYLEEWGSLCIQFEDIVSTEKRQIDEYIKAEILGNRILSNVRITEDEIERLIGEVEEWRRIHPDLENNEEAQERDQQLYNLIRAMQSASSNMSDQYQKNVDTKNKLLNELNARRRDRIDQISKKHTTFLGLVQDIRDKAIKDAQGRHLELVRLAKEKKKAEWRKLAMFPDGSRDSILLDEFSNAPEIDLVRIVEKSTFCDIFAEGTDKTILIVEDDLERSNFFADIFSDNKIEFASNAQKAIEKLDNSSYDLICLDYDLGLQTNGNEVCKHIIDNGLSPNAKILIHSMNEEKKHDMIKTLGQRDIEICSFGNIIKDFKQRSEDAKNDTPRESESSSSTDGNSEPTG